ncbi:MAG: hypothetical protein AAGA89_08690 [Pseudomonadota bacterium]
MKRSLGAITAIAAVFLAVSGTSAQQLSDEEIENALQIMRDNGVSEAQLEEHRKNFEKMNAAMAAAAEKSAAAVVPPIPDYQQQDRDNFERDYGDAPDASVAFKDENYALKVTSCRWTKDWYMLDAKAPPGTTGAILSAVKNSSPDGSSYATIDFQVGNYRASQTFDDIPFDGETYRFSGPIDVSGPGGVTKGEISITATCE